MWRSKFLRRLIGAALCATLAISAAHWLIQDRLRADTDADLAHRQLEQAAGLLTLLARAGQVVYGPDGALSHIALPDALPLQPLTDDISRVLGTPVRILPPQTVQVTDTSHVQVPIRDTAGTLLGTLSLERQPVAIAVLSVIDVFLLPGLIFVALSGMIVWSYGRDRETLKTITAEINALAQGSKENTLQKYNPTGVIYPMVKAVIDLRDQYDAIGRTNREALEREIAMRGNLDGMIGQLEAEVGRLIGDLARGDFTGRILARFEYPEIQSLVDGVQSIADTMQTFLRETARVLSAMAAGDLRVGMSGAYVGDFDKVAHGANTSIEQFRTLIGDVQTAVGDGLSAVNRISEFAGDIARRGSEQVAAIQQTAASMEQISTAVRLNTEAMAESDRMARDVAASTEEGARATRGAIAAVERIRASSEEINDIVRVIEGIAFQTTILALNSAIEAARAGEAGRGFSVVATEVRSLAKRSSDAAKEIKTLITASQQMVIEGVDMVQSAGAALDEIQTGIQGLSHRISRVARSESEQANAIGQINTGIAHIENLTGQAADLSDRSASEAEIFARSMQIVATQMDRFQVASGPARPAAPAPATRTAPPVTSGWDDSHRPRAAG